MPPATKFSYAGELRARKMRVTTSRLSSTRKIHTDNLCRTFTSQVGITRDSLAKYNVLKRPTKIYLYLNFVSNASCLNDAVSAIALEFEVFLFVLRSEKEPQTF